MNHFKNKYVFLVILLTIIFLFAYKSPSAKKTENKPKPSPTIANTNSAVNPKKTDKKNIDFNIRTYKGTIPCVDCDGIETTLTLTRTGNKNEGKYKYTEKYLGTNESDMLFEGEWTMGEGLDEDPNAEIVVLDPEDPDSILGFLVLSETELEELDEEGYRYEDSEKYRLTLQPLP